MLSLDLLPEPFIRFAVMISLTAAFSGLGLIFMVSFLEYTRPIHPIEYFGMALAIGLALVILLVSGLTLLRIPLTKSNLSIALLSGCGICILHLLHKKSNSRIQLSFSRDHSLIEKLLPISLVFILVFLRLIQIRGVVVPNWYDGLMHASRLQEFTLRSSIPFDNIYRVGFYEIALVVQSFWALTPPQTILLLGQWLSVVCGLSFYMFARRYIHNAYASSLSFAVYSFSLLFPSHLISWGRYPYLLGLALLPPAILASQDYINNRRGSFLAGSVFVVSLGLTHYGSLLIWLSLILIYLINKISSGKKRRPETLGNRKAVLFRPFLLVFPALIVILSKIFDPLYQHVIQNGLISQIYDTEFQFGTQYILKLFRAHDGLLILLWLIWVSWSLVWKRNLLYITLFWPLAIWFLSWIQYQIVGSSILTYENLIALLSIPLSLSIGLFAQQLLLLLIKLDSSKVQPLFRHRLKSHSSILSSIAILVSVFSGPLTIDPGTALFTNEDMLAMKWISMSTSKDAGFLIRTVSWDNNTLMPSDGGGWITFLTGRRTIIPQIGELYDICEFATDHGVNYLYFGKQRANDGFDLRLSDMNVNSYVVVYGNQSVEIVSLYCP